MCIQWVLRLSDSLLTIIAAAIELGLPSVAALFSFTSGYKKKLGITVLGATLPWLILYLFTFVISQLNPQEVTFAVHAMWIMSLLPFCISFVLTLIMFVLNRKSSKLWLNFVSGLVTFPIVLLLSYTLNN